MRTTVLDPNRLRQLPSQFSWIDQTLVHRRYFQRACSDAWALYCFLVTVADANAMSYYADRTLCEPLAISPSALNNARQQLTALNLIAFRAPLIQVLAVAPSPP